MKDTLNAVTLRGTGCFTGTPCAVTLRRTTGPTTLTAGGETVPLRHARLAPSVHSTAVYVGSHIVATVEHLAAALCGLGIYEGVDCWVQGGEVPLMDGTAEAFVDALGQLGVGSAPSGVHITHIGEVRVGSSLYTFTPGAGFEVASELVCEDARFSKSAHYTYPSETFAQSIACARTFLFTRDVDAYLALGQRASLRPEDVVIIGHELYAAGRQPDHDEPARHKLLDLLGDLYLHGGCPRGTVRAVRPGHAATHSAMAEAWRRGILAEVAGPAS